ncbi:MAG: HlyD family efflux transporter periplasmic adaptor subunit [Enhydrobacter sp.]|nr:MAG: HlyD family efflux transporter periplasmic adaptor subunit [Enhydrobacter sp.]
MARAQKYRWGAASVAILFVVAAIVLWLAPTRQTSSAQDGIRATGPLISRGYTDAPAGTVVVAGDPGGGSVLTELRVVDGQKVKRNEVVAVLSNYAVSDNKVRTTEVELEKARLTRDAITKGYRVAEIGMQEIVVQTKAEELKLKKLELARSGKPPDMKQIEQTIAEQEYDRENIKLRILKETLATDLAHVETDITIIQANLDNARANREMALVRSPIDGVILQIFTRQGERVAHAGIVKIVDMSKLRVFADVDEVHLGRVAAGGKVEVTFRGSQAVYRGTISRIAATVKRMQRIEPDGGSSTDARVVQVEIELDNPAGMPQVLGRETRVTFL